MRLVTRTRAKFKVERFLRFLTILLGAYSCLYDRYKIMLPITCLCLSGEPGLRYDFSSKHHDPTHPTSTSPLLALV